MSRGFGVSPVPDDVFANRIRKFPMLWLSAVRREIKVLWRNIQSEYQLRGESKRVRNIKHTMLGRR